MEHFTQMVAEMVPEWSEPRLLKEDRSTEKFTYVNEKSVKPTNRRLGKGLNDILRNNRADSSNYLNKLFKNNDLQKKEGT